MGHFAVPESRVPLKTIDWVEKSYIPCLIFTWTSTARGCIVRIISLAFWIVRSGDESWVPLFRSFPATPSTKMFKGEATLVEWSFKRELADILCRLLTSVSELGNDSELLRRACSRRASQTKRHSIFSSRPKRLFQEGKRLKLKFSFVCSLSSHWSRMLFRMLLWNWAFIHMLKYADSYEAGLSVQQFSMQFFAIQRFKTLKSTGFLTYQSLFQRQQ